MSEIIRWGMALMFMASLWAMAAFLIYRQAPGWGWFLACITLVMLFTSIHIDSKKDGKDAVKHGSQQETQP